MASPLEKCKKLCETTMRSSQFEYTQKKKFN